MPFSLHTDVARLADGSRQRVEVYEVDLFYGGTWTTAYAEALADPLVGTRLLAGHRLVAEFVPGGAVTLRPL